MEGRAGPEAKPLHTTYKGGEAEHEVRELLAYGRLLTSSVRREEELRQPHPKSSLALGLHLPRLPAEDASLEVVSILAA